MPTDNLMPKPMPRNPNELVSQTEAAVLAGIARQNIPGAFSRGALEGEVVAGRLFIVRRSAERLGKERKKRAAVKRAA